MNKEEQLQEIEILQAIYPEELFLHSDTSYTIALQLNTEPEVQLLVDVEYPLEYPEVIPTLDVRQNKGNFSAINLARIQQSAYACAKENLGIASVYAIISQVKDFAEELHAKEIKEQERKHLENLRIQEEKEQAKFRGTPVTKETFAEWRKKFRKEMGLDSLAKQKSDRLTGREIFEKGYAQAIDDDISEENEVVIK